MKAFNPTEHPRAAEGIFTHKLHSVDGGISLGEDLLTVAARVFPDAEDIIFTDARADRDGPAITVEYAGTSYTVSGTGSVDVTDEFGDPVDGHAVLSALTGEDDPEQAALEALEEFSEQAHVPVGNPAVDDLAALAADAGHVVNADRRTGAVTLSTITRKYTAAIHFNPDGSTTRTINGHDVPGFGLSYGNAGNLERWAEQHADRIRGAVGGNKVPV